MYKDHFALREAPFSIAPDPRYLYLSDAHREALAHLLYGLRGDGGFVLLTGEVGTGKTTICRCLLEQLPQEVQVALVLNPSLSVPELLATICDDLGVSYPQGNVSNKVFIDALNRFLLASHSRGLTTVLIVDEAQNLSAAVLEQLRLLTNLETGSRKLLQIILIGQPELRDLLGRSDLRQVAQRITARYHLGSLDRAGIIEYIRHRLKVAGAKSPIFTPGAVNALYRLSRGIPRLVNVVADRALLGAYARGRSTIGAGLVRQAGREVLAPVAPARRRLVWAAFALLVVAGLAGLAQSRWPESLFPVAARFTADASSDAGSETEEAPLPPAEETTRGVTLTGGERRQAENGLLQQWGMAADAEADFCAAARGAGLECLENVGSLSLLRLLDRPALLPLHIADGELAYVGLVGLQGETAVLLADGEKIEIPVAELERYWLGEFTLLWRPSASVRSLRLGDEGETVAWLARVLPAGEEEEGAMESPSGFFDARLEARVKRFQLKNGLLPDGIAGPKTLILLNQHLAAPGPRLSRLAMES